MTFGELTCTYELLLYFKLKLHNSVATTKMRRVIAFNFVLGLVKCK